MSTFVPDLGLDVSCDCSITAKGMGLHDLIKISQIVSKQFEGAVVDDFNKEVPSIVFKSRWTPPHTLIIKISKVYRSYEFILVGNFRNKEINEFVISAGELVSHKQELL